MDKGGGVGTAGAKHAVGCIGHLNPVRETVVRDNGKGSNAASGARATVAWRRLASILGILAGACGACQAGVSTAQLLEARRYHALSSQSRGGGERNCPRAASGWI